MNDTTNADWYVAHGPAKPVRTEHQELIASMRVLANSMMFANKTLQQALYHAATELEAVTRDKASLEYSSAKLFAACQSAYRLSDQRRVNRAHDEEADAVETQLRIALATARGAYS